MQPIPSLYQYAVISALAHTKELFSECIHTRQRWKDSTLAFGFWFDWMPQTLCSNEFGWVRIWNCLPESGKANVCLVAMFIHNLAHQVQGKQSPDTTGDHWVIWCHYSCSSQVAGCITRSLSLLLKVSTHAWDCICMLHHTRNTFGPS